MALLPPDSIYTIRNVDNVPVYSLAFSFLPGGLERLLAGSKNGYVYAYNLQVSPHYSKNIVRHDLMRVKPARRFVWLLKYCAVPLFTRYPH